MSHCHSSADAHQPWQMAQAIAREAVQAAPSVEAAWATVDQLLGRLRAAGADGKTLADLDLAVGDLSWTAADEAAAAGAQAARRFPTDPAYRALAAGLCGAVEEGCGLPREGWSRRCPLRPRQPRRRRHACRRQYAPAA